MHPFLRSNSIIGKISEFLFDNDEVCMVFFSISVKILDKFIHFWGSNSRIEEEWKYLGV